MLTRGAFLRRLAGLALVAPTLLSACTAPSPPASPTSPPAAAPTPPPTAHYDSANGRSDGRQRGRSQTGAHHRCNRPGRRLRCRAPDVHSRKGSETRSAKHRPGRRRRVPQLPQSHPLQRRAAATRTGRRRQRALAELLPTVHPAGAEPRVAGDQSSAQRDAAAQRGARRPTT